MARELLLLLLQLPALVLLCPPALASLVLVLRGLTEASVRSLLLLCPRVSHQLRLVLRGLTLVRSLVPCLLSY